MELSAAAKGKAEPTGRGRGSQATGTASGRRLCEQQRAEQAGPAQGQGQPQGQKTKKTRGQKKAEKRGKELKELRAKVKQQDGGSRGG